MNPSTALATVLVDELVRGGVREAVLAPGSRSAPLAFALHTADAEGRLRLHVRVDERSAGYLALGLAKASQIPVPVVTTSGTAVANLHPAVLEASESGVPLLVLSADRPPELRGTGANQTVDQLGLFGRAVRHFHDLGAPEARAGQQSAWRGAVCRALAAARGTLTGDAGPVHVNVPFREPLVPDVPDETPWPEPLHGRADGGPWTRVQPAAAAAVPVEVDGWPARTLVVVGDASPALGQAAVRLAEAAGWPVVSEPSGNARRGPHAITLGHMLVSDPALRPDRVLVIGRPTLTRSVQALLRDPAVEVHAVPAGPRWADPAHAVAHVHAVLPVHGGHGRPDPAWVERWRAADAAAITAHGLPSWSGPAIAAALHARLASGSLLVAGSSLAVRDLQWASPRDEVTVLANRGAAGIDGTVSTAIGAALAWQAAGGGRAYALVGDLTFVHDSNGLLLGPDEPEPQLTIVVVNDDGGGIFTGLEPGRPEHAAAFDRVFRTPTGVDLAALCAASGTPHTRVGTLADLVATATDPRADLQVVEARL